MRFQKNSSRNKIKRSRQIPWVKIIWACIFVSCVSGTIWFIAFSPYLQITTITIDTNNSILQRKLQAVVRAALQDSMFFFIPTHNEVLLSEQMVRQRVAEVTSLPITIQKKLPHEIVITPDIEQILVSATHGSDVYLLGSTGKAIVKTDIPESTEYYNVLLVNPNNEEHLGDQVITVSIAELIKKIIDVREDTTYSAVYPTQFKYDSQDPNTLQLITEKGVAIYTTATRGIKEQLLSAITAMQNLKSSEYITSYIDVRVAGKAYIKNY